MGLNIKKAIAEKQLTSKEVAEKMGISAVGLSQHINGNPSVEVLNRIARAIECDVSELFDKIDNTTVCPHCGGKIDIKKAD